MLLGTKYGWDTTFLTEQFHPRSMGRPYPGTRSLEQGDQDGHRVVMHLDELDHYGICAWIQEEFSHGLSFSMQSCNNRLKKMWVGG